MALEPRKRQGLTTGDVARMLGVSKRRVATLFDQGVLTGYKHPVIGWRVIERESVEGLAKKSGIELSEGMEARPRRGRSRKTTKSFKRKLASQWRKKKAEIGGGSSPLNLSPRKENAET